jgi:hypothetical protein
MLISPRSRDRYYGDVMHVLGKFDRLPGGYFFSGGARKNYMGIDHHRQYSHMTLMDEKRPKPIFRVNPEKTGF